MAAAMGGVEPAAPLIRKARPRIPWFDLLDEILQGGEWKGLTEDPLFYPPSVGVRPERVRENTDAILDSFGGGQT